MSRTRIFIFGVVSLFVMSITSCQTKQKNWYSMNGAAWNTIYNILYESNKNLDDSIFELITHIENSLSVFNDFSIITSVNNGDTVEVDSDFIKVFEASREVSISSKGWFDPTVGRLVNLWGFGTTGKNRTTDPTQEELDSALSTVGIVDCIIENGRIIKKNPKTIINFSAIAKGFGCDLIGNMMEKHGVENFLIEIGGEIFLKGHNPNGSKWVVQIDAPVERSATGELHEQLLKIAVTDCGIATSGNYRNYRYSKKRGKFGHTINPFTGYPIETTTLSVTIISPDAMKADGFATACMAMPINDAIRMIGEDDKAAGLFVTAIDELDIDVVHQYHCRRTIIPGTGWVMVETENFPRPID